MVKLNVKIVSMQEPINLTKSAANLTATWICRAENIM